MSRPGAGAGVGSFSGEVLAHRAVPRASRGLCRKSGDELDRGQGNGGANPASPGASGPCSAQIAGDRLAGSHVKRGSELPGAQDQDPWPEQDSTSHVHLRNHLCAFWNITEMLLPIAG